MKRAAVMLLLALGLAFPAAATSTAPPPGASARCRDGTYSFSQHHSGTCSHHGGVAQWLDGGTTTAATPTTHPGVALGRTVLLRPRTLSRGCTLGPNPDRRCSPGAYSSALTKAVICAPSFRTSTIRSVSDTEKFAVEQEYGLKPGHYGSTLEIDHIVSLELGGSNDVANLFPELANPRPGYRVKDVLENRLHALVCDGRMDLRVAQNGIASNWQALYREVFRTQPQTAAGRPPVVPSRHLTFRSTSGTLHAPAKAGGGSSALPE